MMTRRSLLALVHAASAEPASDPAGALLNHFYATVDSSTYAAIEANVFLREQFAPFEKRTTIRNDSTYSGLYFYGTQTYFEFFEENKGDRKPGDAGVAIGLESPGSSDLLRAQWQKLQPSLTTMITRLLDGSPIDWFQMTSFEETRAKSVVEGLRLFSMEYAPGFAKSWNPSAPRSIEQKAILAAYCAKLQLSKLRETAMLDNVRHLEIEAPEPGIRLRSAQLEAAGWRLRPKRGSILCTGANASVLFRFAAKPLGVSRIEFQLKRSVPVQTLRIGSTTLEIQRSARATWRLRS